MVARRRAGLLLPLALCVPYASCQTVEKVMSSKQMRRIHKRLDADGDGRVSMSEGMKYVEALRWNISDAQLGQILSNMDSDKDGSLSPTEFQEDLKHWSLEEEEKEQVESKAESMFAYADDDGNELLDRLEVPMFFCWVFKFRRIDTDGDGALSMKEFKKGEAKKLPAQAPPEQLKEEERQGKEIFRALDTDGDKSLSVKEYSKFHFGTYQGQEALRKLFEVADADADKHLTSKELVKARESQKFHGTSAYYHLKDWIAKAEL